MDVAVSALRAELSSWLERARNGEEVVITDRGTPVARLGPVETAPLIEQLVQRGVIGKARSSARPAARSTRRVPADGSVSDLVTNQRR